MKILYVENDADARETMRRGLEDQGHNVEVANDARDGLTTAIAMQPDIILIDIWLDELDGLILAAQMRAEKTLKNALLIALTAADAREYRARALAAGCVGYLNKPIPPSQLMTRIAPYLNGQREPLTDAEMIHYLQRNSDQLVVELQKRIQLLDKQLAAIHQIQHQLIQAEQLAATGRLGLTLAHELNNPLQAVYSAIELALDSRTSQTSRKEYLTIALHDVYRATETIRQLLDVNSPKAQVMSEVDIVGLVQDILTLVGKRISSAGVTIEVRRADDAYRVQGIYAQLYQLLLNLVLNALDAMPDGGPLIISLERSADCLMLSVTDSGSGIATGAQLFKPFYTTKADGHGLGLYVCQLIASAHHARIEGFNNQTHGPMHGATFRVMIPHTQPDPLTLPIADPFALR